MAFQLIFTVDSNTVIMLWVTNFPIKWDFIVTTESSDVRIMCAPVYLSYSALSLAAKVSRWNMEQLK